MVKRRPSTSTWSTPAPKPGPSARLSKTGQAFRPEGGSSAESRSKGYRIHATVKPDAPAGTFKQEVLLKTNDPTNPSLTFNVLGNIQATLSVIPDLVTLNPVKVGDMATKKILVKGSRPFRILGIDGQEDGITAVIPETRKAQTQFVEIHFRPGQLGEMKKQLTIRTDLNDEKVIVTIQGNGT